MSSLMKYAERNAVTREAANEAGVPHNQLIFDTAKSAGPALTYAELMEYAEWASNERREYLSHTLEACDEVAKLKADLEVMAKGRDSLSDLLLEVTRSRDELIEKLRG